MTRNFKSIIEIAQANGCAVTKKQAVAELGGYYHCNADFHIGNSLSAMVKQGILERVKRGEFQLLQKPTKKAAPIAANQIQLF